jgi:hypothetical protein
MLSLRAKGPWVVQLLVENRFYIQGQNDLDSWHFDHKIIKSYLLVKYKCTCETWRPGSYGFWISNRKSFKHTRSNDLYLWLFDITVKGLRLKGWWLSSFEPVFTYILTYESLAKLSKGFKTNAHVKAEGKSQWVVQLLNEGPFYIQGQSHLDLWHIDAKVDKDH